MIVGWAWLALLIYWNIAAIWVNRATYTEPWWQRFMHGLPLAAAFYLILFRHGPSLFFGPMYERQWSNGFVYVALAITFAGLLWAVWARVHLGRYWSGMITLKEGHKLITTGPYRFTRHPIYTGWLTGIFGSALTAGTGDALLGVAIVAIAFTWKLRREEKLLIQQFGDEYRRFAEDVRWALVPGVY
jgi:protein-S-isoprenylcysteine O-methyltransferase Ste14